jgi:hypothetical protein
MRMKTRLWAVTTLLALLVAPGLSCFLPRQLLSAAENQCCRKMGLQCGSKEMDSQQSCCKAPSQEGVQPFVGSIEHSRLAPATTVAAFLSVEPSLIRLVVASALTVAQVHSPPLILSETNSVLRV